MEHKTLGPQRTFPTHQTYSIFNAICSQQLGRPTDSGYTVCQRRKCVKCALHSRGHEKYIAIDASGLGKAAIFLAVLTLRLVFTASWCFVCIQFPSYGDSSTLPLLFHCTMKAPQAQRWTKVTHEPGGNTFALEELTVRDRTPLN